MELPDAKRRKLSPPNSAVGTTPVTRSAKPLSNGVAVGSGSRPSFISPTKASLARFNPDLLPLPQSEQRKSPRKSPRLRTPGSKINEKDTAINGDTQNHQRDEPSKVNGDTTHATELDVAPSGQTGLSAAPRRRSRTPSAHPSVSKPTQIQSVYGTRGSKLAASAKASQSNGNTHNKITAQSQKQQKGIHIDQSSLDRLPATPTPHGVPPGAAEAESSGPSLPSTPSQLGLEGPHQRQKGLLFGTPSKKAKRAQKQKQMHQMPQRSTEETLQGQSSATERPMVLQLGEKVFLRNLPKPPPTLEQEELRSKNSACTGLERDALALGSTVLKDILYFSWEEPGAKESAALQRQQKKLTNMSERLARLREEIRDLRGLIDSSDGGSAVNSTLDNEVENASDTPIPQLVNLSLKLASFFPFLSSNVATRHSTSGQMVYPPTKHVKISGSKFEDSSLDLGLVLQSHHASFISDDVLAEAQFRIVFDSQSLQVVSLQLLALSEMGANLGIRPILEDWAHDKDQPRVLFSIGRSVNRSLNVAKKRGQCWDLCTERFNDLVSHKSSEKKNRRDDEITFQRKDMTLTIGWIISIKDDGEVQSELSILTEFPQAWWEERILLGREIEDVRAAFDLLVKERGVTEAISEIVRLLFPDKY